MNNLLLLTDSYKVTHYKQYPPDTETIYSYFESRGGKFDNVVFFGLQYFLKEYLVKGISLSMIQEAEEILKCHFDNPSLFNKQGWLNMLTKHNGRLPVRICAVPEGSVNKTLTPLMTIENTDPEFYWLTNYLETLLVQTWYPITVATMSYQCKKIINGYLWETGNEHLVDFKLHDFGFRGVSSVESAMIGGLAHLLNFKGTDTLVSLVCAKKYYNSGCPGFSIPASEHSTITAWGENNEVDAMANMLKQYPEGLVACVSDSFDIYKACSDIWGNTLKNEVLNRPGTLVIRPDSGNPPEVVLRVLNILGDKFGMEKNEKGYFTLNPKVRVIQGDGVDIDMIEQILETMKKHKWSADNIAFGMGGALLQRLDRDTQRFAFKCSAIKRGGEWRDVFKNPVTDTKKVSKAGRFDGLDVVFENGEIKKEYSFDECRNNIGG